MYILKLKALSQVNNDKNVLYRGLRVSFTSWCYLMFTKAKVRFCIYISFSNNIEGIKNKKLHGSIIRQDKQPELPEFLLRFYFDIFIPFIKLLSTNVCNYWPNMSLYIMKCQ